MIILVCPCIKKTYPKNFIYMYMYVNFWQKQKVLIKLGFYTKNKYMNNIYMIIPHVNICINYLETF